MMKFKGLLLTIIVVLLALLYSVAVTPADIKTQKTYDKSYCTAVAIWSAQKARGLEPNKRNGHRDYKEIAAEVCPGLRPAP